MVSSMPLRPPYQAADKEKDVHRRQFITSSVVSLAAFSVPTVALRRAAAANRYVALGQLTRIELTVRTVAQVQQDAEVAVIHQIPAATEWCPDGPADTRFDPAPPKAVAPAANPSRWEVAPLPRSYWEWRLPAGPGNPATVTASYVLTVADRTFRHDRYRVRYERLTPDAFPEDVARSLAQCQREIPSDIQAIASGIREQQESAFGRYLTAVGLLRAVNAYAAGLTWSGNDNQGKHINRYDIARTVAQARGWCGPKSSVFRALCIALGIPAREVSGFNLRRFDMQDGPVNYTDTGQGFVDDGKTGNAHVWAEVYLPDAGWTEINVGTNNPFAVPDKYIRVRDTEGPYTKLVRGNTGVSYSDLVSVRRVR